MCCGSLSRRRRVGNWSSHFSPCWNWCGSAKFLSCNAKHSARLRRDPYRPHESQISLSNMSNKAKAAIADNDEIEVAESADSEIVGERTISDAELKSITEALIFVADEPITAKIIADVVRVDRDVAEK